MSATQREDAARQSRWPTRTAGACLRGQPEESAQRHDDHQPAQHMVMGRPQELEPCEQQCDRARPHSKRCRPAWATSGSPPQAVAAREVDGDRGGRECPASIKNGLSNRMAASASTSATATAKPRSPLEGTKYAVSARSPAGPQRLFHTPREIAACATSTIPRRRANVTPAASNAADLESISKTAVVRPPATTPQHEERASAR